MKRIEYSSPELTVIVFDEEDVITTSVVDMDSNGWT